MADDDDGNDAVSAALRGKPGGNFLQVKREGKDKGKQRSSASKTSMDDYLKESEESLSAALGPRWNAKELNENADRSTQRLLNHIGGGKTLRTLKGMMAGMMR